MQADEKLLVRQLVSDFLREKGPVLAEFERDFEDLYDKAEGRLLELRHDHGAWRLPFDASFGDGLFLGTVVGVAAILVREALAVGERLRERNIRKLGPQLAKQTGNPEVVLALCAYALDLIARRERRP